MSKDLFHCNPHTQRRNFLIGVCAYIYDPAALFEILHYVQDDKAGDIIKRLGLYGFLSMQIRMAKRFNYVCLFIPSLSKDLSDCSAHRQSRNCLIAISPHIYDPTELCEILHYVQDDKAVDIIKRLGLYGFLSMQIRMAKQLSVVLNAVKDLSH